MPRNQGTSRKGKPKKNDRAAGMGKALQRAQGQRGRSSRRPGGGMEIHAGVESIGISQQVDTNTKSVLELNDLDDFLLQADLANREFQSEKEGLVVLDATTYQPSTTVQWADQKTDFVFKELSVPRRPAWDETTTSQELARREQQAFLEWRRGIAQREEELMRASSASAVTPFEKNLEVWRQLWRVLERSSCVLQLVDARNPLFYLSEDLREYAELALGKPMMVLINKSDYLSAKQRAIWHDHLTQQGWGHVVFFSAVREQAKLDEAARRQRKQEERVDPRLQAEDDNDGEEKQEENYDIKIEKQKEEAGPESTDGIGIDVPLTREQLMETMLAFARQHGCKPDPKYDNRIQFGLCGFPNVGKSSVINVLVGSSKHQHGVVRVGVASQPGKTKHFQTLLLPDSDEMMLCDCPGLVFPSFVSNTADLIAAGVYPISQMRDHWPVINLICQRIPREIINAHYGIQLPTPTEQELRERGLGEVPPPTGEEFLSTLCVARSMLAASSGVPDWQRAARMVIKDYATGKLLYSHPPPNLEDTASFQRETVVTALQNTEKLRKKLLSQNGEGCLTQESSIEQTDLEDVVDDDLLELVGGVPSENPAAAGKSGKKGRNMHKWGKKDRKHRNKDPYGCYSTPDEALQETAGSAGVVVNAGKYGKKGYTRPSGYGGNRGILKPPSYT